MVGANSGRRGFLAGVTGLGLGAALQGVPAAQAATRSSKPNIIFILADDLGYADVSCFGNPDFSTPAIDRIAHDGIRLTHAYANSAVCSATRTALITGRYQDRIACGLEEPISGANKAVGLTPGLPTCQHS